MPTTNLLINTDLGRIKYDSIKANPTVTVAMWKAENAYVYAEVRGRCVAEVAGQMARDHIDSCAIRYTGNPYAFPIDKGRVILKIAVEKQRSQNL
jgi:hypothetical protein